MTKEILPIETQLVENLRKAKSKLAEAQLDVTGAESALYLSIKDKLPEKGTTHFNGLKVVTKFYEKWSQEKLNEIEKIWSAKSNLPFPFKKEWKADGKAVTYLRENAKDTYSVLSDALTLTEAKPSFELTGE